MPPGSYEIRVSLAGDQAEVTGLALPLLKLAPTANEVKIDRVAMSVLVNGKPFFPYGMMQGLDFDDLAKYNFNTYCLACWGIGADVPGTLRLLENARTNNLMIIDWWERYQPKSFVHGGRGANRPLFESCLETFKAAIPQIKHHPNLLAYYTEDEPSYSDKDDLIAIQQAAHRLDPYHPAFALNCMQFMFPEGSDLAIFDTYMGAGYCGTEPDVMIKPIAESHARAIKYRFPMWVVLASRMWSGPEPMTPAKQRCQTYLAIVYGAKGIIYFGGRPEYIPIWEEMGRMGAEFRQLTPVILSPGVAQTVTVTPAAAREAIHMLEKEYEGKRYLIAVNAKKDGCPVTFSFSSALKSVREVFEGRDLAAKGTVFEDQFKGYATHVYEVDMSASR